eukprot:571743-Rhodomonas_salina.1
MSRGDGVAAMNMAAVNVCVCLGMRKRKGIAFEDRVQHSSCRPTHAREKEEKGKESACIQTK